MTIVFIEEQGSKHKMTAGKNTSIGAINASKPINKYVKRRQIICANLTKLV